jgi:hypothetical protein
MVKDCFNFILSKPTMIQNSCQNILENNCKNVSTLFAYWVTNLKE